MTISKAMRRRLLCASALLVSCVLTVQAADREIIPVESTEQLRTRGVGLQDFLVRMPTDSQLEECDFNSALISDDEDQPKAGSIYLRMLWQHFEPEEGEYAWEKLDRILECANEKGQSVDFRLMLTYPGNTQCSASELSIDPDCVAYETIPDWLIERINTHTTDLFATSEYQLPDWSDPVFIEKHTALIKALGERYNAHPDINSIDIGSVGLWGEWHVHGDSELMPTVEQQKAVVDLYKASFPDIPLVALADSYYKEESNEFGELTLYQTDVIKTGWRGDSWGLPYFNNDRYQPLNDVIPERWKTHPVSVETSDTVSSWSGANLWPDYEEPTKDIQLAFDDAISWHVSQINLKGEAIPEAFSETFQDATKKIGFRLVLRKAVLPESLPVNAPLAINLQWENVGIAPPYRDFRIAARLRDSEGAIVAQIISDESVKGWLPEVAIASSHSLNLPAELQSGSYSVELGVVFHSAPTRTVPIAVEGRTEDDWYPLGALSITNAAPVASDASITLRQDQPADISVAATDPEDQAMTYTVTEAPEHGVLTGSLPDVIYTSNETHPGSDSFSYSANDGELDSEVAIVSINVFPVITEGEAENELALGEIIVDGDLSDWSEITSFGLDGDDLAEEEAEANWQQAWMSHDAKRLYLAYQNNGLINAVDTWPWSIFLDTDTKTTTGFVANNNLGADYLISGKRLFKYNGTGADWAWELVPETVSAGVQGEIAELSLLRTSLDSPTSMRVLFRGDNSAQIGRYFVDNYPNGDDGYFTYTLGESAENPMVVEELSHYFDMPSYVVDGDISDWSVTPSFGNDGNDITLENAQADILEMWMAHNDTDLYISYRNDGDINTEVLWPWQVLLDTDNEGTTGFQAGNDIGAEFMIQGVALYQYTGSGSDWSWEYLQATDSAIEADIAEMKFPRSALGDPDRLRFIMIARNSPFTGDWSSLGVDRYPDQSIGYLSYRLIKPVEELVIDGDLSDWDEIAPAGEDPNDVEVVGSEADYLKIWLATTEEDLFVAYLNDGPINQTTMWPWQMFMDTDSDRESGFKVVPTFGADYMLQGRALYKYVGEGSDWSWEYVSSSENAVINDSAEFRLSREDLGDITDMHILFKASNWVFTGSFDTNGNDYYPHNEPDTEGGGAFIGLSFPPE